MVLVLAISICIWAVIAAGCTAVGSTGAIGWPTHEQFQFRIVVVLTASLVGAALGSAGVAYQSVLRNPLADPYLLGASSGAALMAYLWRLPAASGWHLFQGDAATALGQQGFAFAGAIASMAIVFAVAQRRGALEPVTLLLVGVIVNAVNGSIILLVDAIFGNLPGGAGPLTFLIGAIQTNLTTLQIATAGTLCLIGFIVLMYVSGQLNAAALSEDEASAMGIRVQRLRWIALICGIDDDRGGGVDQRADRIHRIDLPARGEIDHGSGCKSAVARIDVARGDAAGDRGCGISRKLSGGNSLRTVLPVGVLTGLLGGPFFLLLLLQKRRV